MIPPTPNLVDQRIYGLTGAWVTPQTVTSLKGVGDGCDLLIVHRWSTPSVNLVPPYFSPSEQPGQNYMHLEVGIGRQGILDDPPTPSYEGTSIGLILLSLLWELMAL